jgi:uridine kinase
MVDQRVEDLRTPITMDCDVEFLDITSLEGFRAYQRSASFLMIYAAKSVLGKQARIVIEHSINKNYYCNIFSLEEAKNRENAATIEVTDDLLGKIEQKMRETVEADLPIERMTLTVDEAEKICARFGFHDKVSNLQYRRTSNVNFYKMGWFYDYFFGRMLPSTGLITQFKLSKWNTGFILQFPSAAHDYEMTEFTPSSKVMEVFAESGEWGRILKVDTVGALNDLICAGGAGDIMRVCEALHEKKLAYLADRIQTEHKSFVLIAGPSSSGKTTFAHRLCVQLRVDGMRPTVISLDDYYLNREDSPRDADGQFDFETVDALDLVQLNSDMSRLLRGETVEIPEYNFAEGRREYRGRKLKLEPGSVLVMEGIHGLNSRVSEQIPAEKKFKVFVSALTQLNMDDHNRIPTTDTRLIRRIVRDYRTRGSNARESIDMWPSVLRGENKYIFPFQDEADSFFNTALIYEMCVLKQFAEPLLFGVPKSAQAYTEARRLIKFLGSFLGVSSEQVAVKSILREFIGGSCFE